MKVIGIIPARYASSRFPGKPLVDIFGKSMIQRVYEQCKKCNLLDDVIVATDDKRIYNHIVDFSGKVMMTSTTHQSGTDRCNEAIHNIQEQYDIVINIQGDEPFINPLQIDEIMHLFDNPKTQIGTLAKKIDNMAIVEDENTPKVIFDKKGNALNFCRKISNISTESTYYKHVGIYAYKKDILEKICQLPQSKNEIREQLEQLRWLDNNYNIKVGISNFQTLSVDSPEDIEKIQQQMR
ncbi:MAG: 3-deoxy-manno-octulosonate cytidylyltransferase [Bacteroidota bacterium]|nr:3-deoxy-manno-octulosonate cytidylyltransferase [Bacteroidota bacterium]